MFQAADGPLYVSMLNDAMFARLATVLGFDDWLADPRPGHQRGPPAARGRTLPAAGRLAGAAAAVALGIGLHRA
ncbi:hypothetical protein ACTMU2_41340 [Cupriavidus basilensis]